MHSEEAPEAQDPLDELHDQLSSWRQGDLVAGDLLSAVLVFRRSEPVTEATAALAAEDDGNNDLMIGEIDFDQLVVVSQTCDVVEHPRSSPYITLAPVVQITDEGRAMEARRGYMPRYAPVPGAGANAFADLAFHVTIEKPVLRDAAKTSGLTNDEEIRLFQDVAQRHASRFAFPNEMAVAFEPLRRRLREKKDKDSFEGKALRLIDEIRLLATPDWAADVLDVDVFFLLKSREAVEALEADPSVWEKQRAAWEARCGTNDKISKLRLILVPFEELDANTYRASEKLDLGGMSPQ